MTSRRQRFTVALMQHGKHLWSNKRTQEAEIQKSLKSTSQGDNKRLKCFTKRMIESSMDAFLSLVQQKNRFSSSFQWRLAMNILLICPDFEFLPLKLKETLSLVRKKFQRKTSLWPPWIFQSIWDSFYGKSADVSNAANATNRFFFSLDRTEMIWFIDHKEMEIRV